ncbi:MAG: hypothetical protein Kow00127_19460 [Bacteroidales bacterium]
MRITGIVFWLWLIPFVAGAQVGTDQSSWVLGSEDIMVSDKTDSRVVSAGRIEQEREWAPVTVYVVTDDEIFERGYTTLTDLLRDIPGIQVTDVAGARDGSSFLLNGLYGNYYCRILVDGQPVTPSVLPGMPLDGVLPLHAAERVEVVTGNNSSVWGGEAVAGVVNIITKKSPRPVWVRSGISLGTGPWFNMHTLIGGTTGKPGKQLQYTLTAKLNNEKDLQVTRSYDEVYTPGRYSEEAVNEPWYRGDTLSPETGDLPRRAEYLGFSLSYRNTGFSFSHSERAMHSSTGLSTGTYGYFNRNARLFDIMNRALFYWSFETGKIQHRTTTGWLNYRLDNYSGFQYIKDRGDRGFVYKFSGSDDIWIDHVLSLVNKSFSFSAGFSGAYKGNLPETNGLDSPFPTGEFQPFSLIDSTFNPVATQWKSYNYYSIGTFAHSSIQLKRLLLEAGIRFDYHELYGNQLSPFTGITYRKAGWTLAFQAGMGFRPPSLYYEHYNDFYAKGNQMIYQWTEGAPLYAERFRNAGLRISHPVTSEISLTLSGNYHLLDRQISPSPILIDTTLFPDAENNLAFSWRNDPDSKARLGSFQLTADGDFRETKAKWHSQLSATYNFGREVLPNGLGELDGVRAVPEYLIQFTLSVQPADGWKLFGRMTAAGKSMKRFYPVPPDQMEIVGLPVSVDGYFLIDLISHWTITKYLSGFIEVRNLGSTPRGGLDATGTYDDLIYNPQPLRQIRGGFNFRLE